MLLSHLLHNNNKITIALTEKQWWQYLGMGWFFCLHLIQDHLACGLNLGSDESELESAR